MSPSDTKVLVSLIYGDSQIYTSAYQKSQIYEKAGKTVYTYCFDGHPQYDWILEYQTEFAGLGHAAELPLEFGNIDFWLYKKIFNGLDPEGWEVKLADFIQTEFSSFFKHGKPTEGNYYYLLYIFQLILRVWLGTL